MTITAALPRCPVPACPVRYVNGGPDRPCRDHASDGTSDYAAAAAELGIELPPPGRSQQQAPSGEE